MTTRSSQLQQSFLLTGVGSAAVLVVLLALVAGNSANTTLRRQANDRGREVATRVSALVTQYLRERRREAEVLAQLPDVVDAARKASQDAVQRGLDKQDIATLERAFAGRRELGGDPTLQAFIRNYGQVSDFAEIFFTESHGYNVLASDRTSDFVQSDEDWWQQAFRQGAYEGEPAYDSSSAVVSISYNVAVRPTKTARPLGVLKAVFALDRLARLLAAADLGGDAVLEVVDERGHLVVSPDPKLLLQPLPDAALIPRRNAAVDTTLASARGEELVVSVPANEGRWWVVFRQPGASAYAAARATKQQIWFGALALFAVTIAVLVALGTWLNRRVTRPVKIAGEVAGKIASGDLSISVVSQQAETADVQELLSSVHTMVVALRRLVGAIRTAADEAAAMAAEISASTQQMSASTEELTATTQDLSQRAGQQAQLVRSAAQDAARILQIATVLATGAEEAVRRNATLAGLARRHREQLDQSTAQLARLAEDIGRGAEEAEALSQASAEIQKFVAQAKAVATQTNMLALNAAIEAARAGPQGRGFAVVADEVRKLASHAAASAGETGDVVRGVLARVQATRDRLTRLAQGGAAVRETAQAAAQGLSTVANEADANDAWGKEIATSANELRMLVEEISTRLHTLAKGTDELLASAEEIAASSEEQNASTEEIASSANQLAQAADHLTGAVKSFRLTAEELDDRPREAAD
jgi:methyl-accepting chemotaxis protein